MIDEITQADTRVAAYFVQLLITTNGAVDPMAPLLKLLVKGPHMPIERTWVLNNPAFVAHRNNEFMFLMLGEAVLQIIINEGAW